MAWGPTATIPAALTSARRPLVEEVKSSHEYCLAFAVTSYDKRRRQVAARRAPPRWLHEICGCLHRTTDALGQSIQVRRERLVPQHDVAVPCKIRLRPEGPPKPSKAPLSNF